MEEWEFRSVHNGFRSRMSKENVVSNDGKDGFQVSIDVQQFKPSELSVKVINKSIVVEGKHEEHENDLDGYVTRHFVRRYALPKNYNSNKIISTLSLDGILTVSISKLAFEDKPNEEEKSDETGAYGD